MSDPGLDAARSALASCEATVARLHTMCCDPDRSPRMASIQETIGSVGSDLAVGDDESLQRAVARLTAVGAEIGALQVECCAPARMPLYASTLEDLNRIQVGVATARGTAH